VRVPGRIDLDEQRSSFLQVPESTGAGQSFEVTVVTSGDGCQSIGDVEVTLEGDVANLVPYDIRTLDSRPCTLEIKKFVHVITLQFDAVGEARVILQAEDLYGQPIEFVEIVQVS
jgi:hypothetical protein